MPSSHPSARRFVAEGLFDDVSSFADLEGRISALGVEHTTAIGDAFEIFFEGYLATQPIMQAGQMWLVTQIDRKVRQTLNLPADAKGIDGVYRTRTGDLIPYQVKFRSGRGMLTFTEVAPFLGVTDRARAARLIVTNANELAADIKVRDGVFSLRGIDFDDLTREDFAALADWLRDRPVPLAKKTPRDDQQEALARIEATLATQPRATVVMACGTGKTLVQLWATERLHPKTVLVLVPSLSLLQQTLAVWSHEHAWGDRYEYLAVCSDPTVAHDDDAITLSRQDMDFRVDTDPAIVRRFLSSNADAVKVIFSTYHSTPVVAEGAKGLGPFDVGVFDEAHKTTGPSGGVFAAALSDEKLPIVKRLFFTATPRHYDVSRRDKEGDFRVVSMDDPSIYGPVTHELTFGEAVRRGIICDYRVVIAAVDSREVTDFALTHGITLVDGDLIAARWVAGLLAVQKAVRETSASKVITFHSRVRLAQEFASETPRGVGHYLPDFAVNHVNGEMRTSDRRSILQNFRDDRSLLVTNARCLTEGVDLPAVDIVAFVDARRSRIDIAQAMGRAMRRPQGSDKRFGYVVVPLFTSGGGTALDGGGWDEVVDVLNAMREVDGRLVDVIRELQESRGRGGVFNPKELAERILVLGPAVALAALEREIYVSVVDRFGVSWDERYGQLVAFKDVHGHSDVPLGYPENPKLAKWLSAQRQAERRGTLSADRLARLDALGVVWAVREAWWEQQYQNLVAFKQKRGHCNVSKDDPNASELGAWVSGQRSRLTRLSEKRVARLDALGFVWDPHDAAWDKQWQALVAFRDRHGDSNVPSNYPDNAELSNWLRFQRQVRRRGTLSADRVARLEALGVAWDPRDAQWEERYRELVAFKAENRDCNVPRDFREHPKLGTWLSAQRNARRGTLSADRVARLKAIGVALDPRDTRWDEQYQALLAFKEKHGHCNVPLGYPENPKLGRWVSNQRGGGRPSADRVARLEALGFVWDTNDAQWVSQYQALVAFKEEHGHCNVPADYPENQPLGMWVTRQRHARQTGELWLSSERMARLDALGFCWSAFKVRRQAQYQALIAFKEKHGHCNVQVLDPDNPELGRWLHGQRQKRQRGTLPADEIARLDALGVVWDFRDSWDERYQQLIAFKERYGHCHVQTVNPESRPLGIWLTWQRKAKRQETLSADRLARLTALSVVWDGIEAQWEIQYQALVAFKAEHGHCNVPFNYPEDISPPSGRRYRPRGTALGSWLQRQRTENGRGTLSADRVERLDALGFTWDPSKRKQPHLPPQG